MGIKEEELIKNKNQGFNLPRFLGMEWKGMERLLLKKTQDRYISLSEAREIYGDAY